MEEHPILSENEKIAMAVAGETTSRIMTLDGTTAQDVIEERNINKFNNQVDQYVEKLNEHSKALDESAEKLADRIDKLEIMPVANYVIARLLAENPFQRIVRSKSGLITDLGGQKPQYKNTDNGQWEEEENLIKVLVIVEVGQECKWAKPGDVIFATSPSLVPIPFYKQNLQLVNENRILAIVNEDLTKRFKNE